jgi:hypothetical protein
MSIYRGLTLAYTPLSTSEVGLARMRWLASLMQPNSKELSFVLMELGERTRKRKFEKYYGIERLGTARI